VPIRDVPALAVALTDTAPLPEPSPTPTTASHGALLAAVQEHDGSASIVTVVVPAAAGNDCDAGVMIFVHGTAVGAGCVTANAWPPIMSSPTRAEPALGVTENPTVPLALPLAPEVIVTHDSPVVAVHGHPAGVVTSTAPDPPLAGIVWLVGESSTAQTVPDWVTRTMMPLIVMSACRTDGAEFAVT